MTSIDMGLTSLLKQCIDYITMGNWDDRGEQCTHFVFHFSEKHYKPSGNDTQLTMLQIGLGFRFVHVILDVENKYVTALE